MRVKKCKKCGTSSLPISEQKMCPNCSIKENVETGRQLKVKKGPRYDKWKKGMKKFLKKL